jgi:hypothetical protein
MAEERWKNSQVVPIRFPEPIPKSFRIHLDVGASYSLPALIHNIITKIVRINTTLMMPPKSSTQPNTSKYVNHKHQGHGI